MSDQKHPPDYRQLLAHEGGRQNFSGGEDHVVAHHLHGVPQASDFREVSKGQGGLARRPRPTTGWKRSSRRLLRNLVWTRPEMRWRAP